MGKIDKEQQFALAHALLKRFHPDAVKAVGENFSAQEKVLLNRRDNFYDLVLEPGRQSGGKGKLASRRKIRNVMIRKFNEAFGAQSPRMEYIDEDPDAQFRTNCCGWSLETHFWFGEGQNLLEYSHAIASENCYLLEGPSPTRMVLGAGVSFCSWLGITSQTEWENLTNENVESCCDAVVKLCRRFFDVAPKLLKGIEFEKIIIEERSHV
jgi:hypothetical protein